MSNPELIKGFFGCFLIGLFVLAIAIGITLAGILL